MIRRYTVFGNPIEHSLSPEIHSLFAEQTQRRVDYTKTLAEEANFADLVRSFQQSGAQGCNVTAPFKELAHSICDQLNDSAKLSGSVNTIKFMENGELHGFNTDGSGLVADIKTTHRFEIKGQHIVIAGAGGATRGILHPLLMEEPESITVCNRTVEKADMLVDRFKEYGPIKALPYDQLQAGPAGIIINATSRSQPDTTALFADELVGSNTMVYDLVYSREPTDFVKWGQSLNAAIATDGLGMLLEQAADAFFIWQDVRPKTRLIMPKLLS